MPRARSGRAPPGKRKRPAAATWGAPENINNAASISWVAAARQPESQRIDSIVADLAFFAEYRASVDRAVRLNIVKQLRAIARHFDWLGDEVQLAPAMKNIPHKRLRCVPAVELLIYEWRPLVGTDSL
jgi:hypothetical protein